MRILFISNLYPPMHLGGMELRCEEVVQGLTERGHVCLVLTSNFTLPGQSVTDLPGVRRQLHLEADVYNYQPFDYLLRHPRKVRENQDTVLKTITEFLPDLVFFWGMWNFSPALVMAARKALPGRVVHSFAGFWPLEPDTHEQYWLSTGGSAAARLFRKALSPLALSRIYRSVQWPDIRFDHAVFCSQFMLDFFVDHGFRCTHLKTVLGGIDVDHFRPPERKVYNFEKMRILFSGGYVEHKGVRVVVDAVRILAERGSDKFRLTVVGQGHPASREATRQQVQEGNLEQVVTLNGPVPRQDMPVLMRDFDILILATLSDEPLGRVVMEGMACGLVVIASNRAGPLEMITDGVNGLLFTPGDSDQLAALLYGLQQEPERAYAIAREARRTAERCFTLKRMNDEMADFLRVALHSSQRSNKRRLDTEND